MCRNMIWGSLSKSNETNIFKDAFEVPAVFHLAGFCIQRSAEGKTQRDSPKLQDLVGYIWKMECNVYNYV